MSRPFFSIIIPTYNREKVIKRAVESVLNQTFKNFEIIVIDNASNDSTVEIVTKINDNRVKLICNSRNLERCVSRNIGIQNAKGLYTCFLDSDDYYLDNHLENYKKNIKISDDSIDMYISNKRIYYENSSNFESCKYINYNDLSFFLINAIIPSRVCIKSNILKKYKFENKYLIVEDTVLWMQIAFKHQIKTIDEITVVYTIHDDNSVNLKNNTFKKRLNGLKKFFRIHTEIKFKIKDNIIKETYNRCYLGTYEHYKNKGEKWSQLKIIMKSLFVYPNITTKHKLKLLIGILKD